jgi:predicted RNA-binding Zn ribbon-like protein
MKYKQYIIPAMIFFLFSACQSQTQEKEKEKEVSETELQTEQLINEIDIHDLEILVIDNCEYIFYKKSPSTYRGFGFMSHKGNCKNPIHFYSRSKKDH